MQNKGPNIYNDVTIIATSQKYPKLSVDNNKSSSSSKRYVCITSEVNAVYSPIRSTAKEA